METRNDADRVESGNSPPAEVRESEARAARIHSLLKLRDKAEAEIAGVLREHLDAVGELAWLAWCEREFGWKRRQAYNHLNPEQLQKDRDRKAEAYRAECAETPLIVAEPEPDPFFQEREADMKEGKVTLSAATSKWQRANGRLPDAKDDWETPLDLYRTLDAEFHFELGPASNGTNAKTPRYFTEKENGLAQPWAPARVFLNPPYSEIEKWIAKAYDESRRGALVVCLIQVNTSAKWWHKYVCTGFGGTQTLIADEVRFLPKRLKYTHPTDPNSGNGSPWGSAIVVYRPAPAPRAVQS